MKYGNNYTLNYIQKKKNGGVKFDIIDEEGFSRIVDGTMEDLKKYFILAMNKLLKMTLKKSKIHLFKIQSYF